MTEQLFWADQIADLIINRKKYNYLNKSYKLPKIITIKSSTSISGVPHIGNASDIIRHDAVLRALKDKGKKVRFIWVGEDMDALRKVPAGIPKNFKKYLGMPVADIPDPEGCCKNYSEHFCKKFIESLENSFGTNPEFLSTANEYRKGTFTKYVKLIFENLETIKQIMNKSRKEPVPKDWNPLKPVCENCGKLITTRTINFENNFLNYVCEDYQFKPFGEEAYTKLSGCKHKGACDITKGNFKILWRVEWGILWATWKVCLEGAGKEHFMPSGSFWTAGEVAEKVFNWPEPYPGRNSIQPYEYITVSGKKMSASVGNVVATWEWPLFAPAQILRLIFLKKPNKVRDFSYQNIPRYVDEFDELQQVYFGKKIIKDKKESNQLKRLYEMSEIEIPKKFPVQIPFDFASMIAQIVPEEKLLESALKILKDSGHIFAKISEKDKKTIEQRLNLAKNWAKDYAPENYKIKLLEKPKELKFSEKQKKSLEILIKDLEKKNFKEKELYTRFFDICKEVDINPKEFFKSVYLILLGKEFGPRLAPFILAISQKEVIKRLKKV